MSKTAHLYHYLGLIFGLAVSLFLFLYFNQNHMYQLAAAAFGCVFYGVWGIMHGLAEQRLTKHVAFEYVALALFVFALVFVSISLK